MKVSYQWLQEVVNVPADPEILARELTMVGLQLESFNRLEDDAALGFEITVNRPDCLSIYGIARELAAIFGISAPSCPPLHPVEVIRPEQGEGHYEAEGLSLRIGIDEPELCARYCGQLISGVRVEPSPSWIRKRLEMCGLRSVNNVVDITNLVMLEVGQPLHAFDYERLAEGTIRVRKARRESLLMIDGRERLLQEPMLVIADAVRAQAVAGVMGGRDSEVSEKTRILLLESAYFQPTSVRKTAKALEVATDASYRFERGVDPQMQANACRRAAALLEEYAGGKIHPVLDVAPGMFSLRRVELRPARITRILGKEIDPAFVHRTLTALGFISKEDQLWEVPSFRVDIFREIDLIEEVARHYGYNNFPDTLPEAARKYQPDYPTFELERNIAQLLRAARLDEACTISFVSPAEGAEGIKLVNPITETADELRMSLLPGLIQSIAYNLRHRNQQVRLFEIGRVFLPDGEKVALGITMLGDYLELKGILEGIIPALGYPRPSFDGSRISVDGRIIGEIRTSALETTEVQTCEIYLSHLVEIPMRRLRYEPIIPFPSVERDASFLLHEGILYVQLEALLEKLNVPELRSYKLIDRYQGENIPAGKVSITLRFVFQSTERTLTSEEADRSYQAIVDHIASAFGAQLRK